MDELKVLFLKYMNNGCTTAEIKHLMLYFSEATHEAELKELINAEIKKDAEADDEILDAHMLHIYDRLKIKLDERPVEKNTIRIFSSYLRYVAAAVVLLAVSVGMYFYINQNNTPDKSAHVADNRGKDVAPGGNKAILVLADGSELSLTDADNGELASQAGIKVSKTADGQLVYELSEGKASTQMAYNTIKTPVGGQYQLNLPDGTKVWLNAASSLTFPANFNGNERKVELKGEAYFEVAKHIGKPFIVSSVSSKNVQEVKVLGTHFNINSYENESDIKTTLLEGSVQVSAKTAVKVLQPGQQSVLDRGKFSVQQVDANQAIDWKNGDFIFADEGIHSIMRKLERWYDIEVVYQGNIPETGFAGEISRGKKLSEVLKVLEITNAVHFKIEGRRVTVMQ
ncbi:FecR family protein [Pedobacter nyackensis]|uniref:FecR family protein n=1 Tax=Pedobacter nyackensis TaxID=475255 RepID=UPI002931EBE5|nr:FecR domain-containing protein [Pedobacter nyackensis]